MGAGAGAGARVFRTALKILFKSSSEYLGTLVAATKASATGVFVPEGLMGCLDNLSPDLGGRKESGRVMEGATEGRSWWRRPRP